MELGLRLGDAPPAKPFFLAEKGGGGGKSGGGGLDLGFCMGLGVRTRETEEEQEEEDKEDEEEQLRESSGDQPVQLELLPFSPVPRQAPLPAPPLLPGQVGLPWQLDHDGLNRGGLDVNRMPATEEMEEEGAVGVAAVSSSSPNSGMSSFRMDFSNFTTGAGEGGERLVEAERASSRASDEEENGLTRKKLRLSKEQSAFLEESFKEHNTLNPKQKLALAKQLNLRPRQVEVWFQNRRARTKLKQTEVDCEYLKRCCEKLTEENRRLQKELQELRALKTAHPFYMHLPATTLTMCPSCERVATTSTTAPNPGAGSGANGNKSNVNPSAAPTGEHANTSGNNQQNPPGFPLRPSSFPFGPQSHNQQQQQQQQNIAASPRHQSAAS